MAIDKKGNRRDLIHRRALFQTAFKALGLVGAAALVEQRALASALDFTPQTDDLKGVLFNHQQMVLLKKLTHLVLPPTKTPGGVELGVHQFLDHQLYSCHEPGDQNKIKTLLIHIENHCLKSFDAEFLALPSSDAEQMLRDIEAKANGFTNADKNAFTFMKSLMVFGYFTSEVGATQVLKYQSVPGGFDGSIPYASVGSAWGSREFY